MSAASPFKYIALRLLFAFFATIPSWRQSVAYLGPDQIWRMEQFLFVDADEVLSIPDETIIERLLSKKEPSFAGIFTNEYGTSYRRGVNCLVEISPEQISWGLVQPTTTRMNKRQVAHMDQLKAKIERINQGIIRSDRFKYRDICYETPTCKDRDFSCYYKVPSLPPPDQDDGTLSWAIRAGSTDRIQVRRDVPGSIGDTDDWGLAAIHWAALKGNPLLIASLLQDGADPISLTRYPQKISIVPRGRSPFFLAAQSGCIECLEILARKSKPLQLADMPLAIPLAAIKSNKPEVFVWIIKNDAKRIYLHVDRVLKELARYGREDYLDFIVDNAPQGFDQSKVLSEAAIEAAKQENWSRFDHLLSLIITQTDDKSVLTGWLKRASSSANIGTLKKLVAAGANPNTNSLKWHKGNVGYFLSIGLYDPKVLATSLTRRDYDLSRSLIQNFNKKPNRTNIEIHKTIEIYFNAATMHHREKLKVLEELALNEDHIDNFLIGKTRGLSKSAAGQLTDFQTYYDFCSLRPTCFGHLQEPPWSDEIFQGRHPEFVRFILGNGHRPSLDQTQIVDQTIRFDRSEMATFLISELWPDVILYPDNLEIALRHQDVDLASAILRGGHLPLFEKDGHLKKKHKNLLRTLIGQTRLPRSPRKRKEIEDQLIELSDWLIKHGASTKGTRKKNPIQLAKKRELHRLALFLEETGNKNR